jgi:methylase of polypeptide subunit release factors
MTLAEFSTARDLRLNSASLRLAVLTEAVDCEWTLNVYATDVSPAAEQVSIEEAEDAAAVDVSLVYLTRAV